MGLRTPLYEQHQLANAKLVDFSGWDMPLHYGSQIEEHHKVRNDAGMFDVSHMLAVEVEGKKAKDFLRYLLANDVAKLKIQNKAIYTCMLNPQGGVIDDLIVYYLNDEHYRIVVNAGTREKDVAWFKEQAPKFDVKITPRNDLAILAIQGPQAREKVAIALDVEIKTKIAELKPFSLCLHNDWQIARTGYTGEDGLEIILPATEIADLWQTLLKNNIAPCGLGARDTLRLEAGLNLYGNDMDETISPLEANLAWTVAFEPADRDFIGRAALEKQQREGLKQKLISLVMQEKGVLRGHQQIEDANQLKGEIVSGGFSPTLGYAIAFARVPTQFQAPAQVIIRDKLIPVQIVKSPFVRNGQKVFVEETTV